MGENSKESSACGDEEILGDRVKHHLRAEPNLIDAKDRTILDSSFEDRQAAYNRSSYLRKRIAKSESLHPKAKKIEVVMTISKDSLGAIYRVYVRPVKR